MLRAERVCTAPRHATPRHARAFPHSLLRSAASGRFPDRAGSRSSARRLGLPPVPGAGAHQSSACVRRERLCARLVVLQTSEMAARKGKSILEAKGGLKGGVLTKKAPEVLREIAEAAKSAGKPEEVSLFCVRLNLLG